MGAYPSVRLTVVIPTRCERLHYMPLPIEDYALLGDLQTAALVGRDGSVDWLCLPRFDSGACFAGLLGDEQNGRWLLAPTDGGARATRRYLDDTLILETTWETETGTVRVLDFMPPRGETPDVVRIVEGVSGRVEMHTELVIRLDYGRVVPWVRRLDGDTLLAIAGPDALCLRTPVDVGGEDMKTVGKFTVAEGRRVPFVLTWYPSFRDLPAEVDAEQALADTTKFWHEWIGRCEYEGEGHDSVHRSLILLALLSAGYAEEADHWRTWLLRAAAGNPEDLQIMYGVAGEQRLVELELDWLPGYEESAPVRTGNLASEQVQLDVYGDLMDALYQARTRGLEASEHAWSLQRVLLRFLERRWRDPDNGIWEIRGELQHFVHSKVMAWVAFDRAVRSIEEYGLKGDLERWRAIRDEIHEEVCREGFDERLGSFTQYYGSGTLDASLLLIPLVGFLRCSDPRVRGTIEAVRRDLTWNGLVLRYHSEEDVDGLPAGEGVFLPCSFWLVDCLELIGDHDAAHALFERLLGLRNDLGLIAEEYHPMERRLLGNFPQAFTHLELVNSAFNLAKNHPSPMELRHARR